MANAGDPRGGVRRITIPLPRMALQPGQRLMFRVVPPSGGGQGRAGPQIQVFGVRPPQPQAQGDLHSAIDRAVREQEAEARRRVEDDHRRRAALRERLTISDPPHVDYNEDSGVVVLSWQPVGGASEGLAPLEGVEYSVDWKESNGDPSVVYSGQMTVCSVSCDNLRAGHTHQFSVTASASGEKGVPSPCASLSLPATPPDKPQPPKLATRAKNGITLRWNAPPDNGAAISLYSLEWDQCGREYEELFNGKSKQFKFNYKFLPGCHALFRVRAQNNIGWSLYSDPLEFSSGASAPSPPSPPTLTHAGVHSVTLLWEAPQDNGSPITSYCLEMDDHTSGYGFCPVYTGDEVQFTSSSLERMTGYTFRLSAKNDRGSSPFSHPVTYHTLPDAPGCPDAPYLKDRPHSTSLHIAWQPPKDDGGTHIHSYILQLDDGHGGECCDSYQGSAVSHLAEGLVPGRSYRCRVCALSEGGRGKWSPLGQFQTPATVPHPPQALRVTGEVTQVSVTLEWEPPEFDGGSPVIYYSVEMRLGEEGPWKVEVKPSTFTPPDYPTSISHTMTRLSPGEHYTFRVNCRNSIGVSMYSSDCDCMTAAGEPDPPTQLEVTGLTANAAHIQWKPSLEHGSPVTEYQLEYWILGCDRRLVSVDQTISYAIRTLMPATEYNARVKAGSVVGPSDWSIPITFTTLPSTPSPPSHINVITRTPTTLHVAWAVPESKGSPLVAYHIETSAGHVTPLTATETQFTLRDLQPSTTYRLRVQGENGVGRGSFSPYITASTLPPPPTPPLLTLTSCTSHSLKIAWGKKPIKGLEYLLQMAPGGSRFHVVYRGSGTSYRISKLQPSSEYTMRVAAMSESGQGEWSNQVTFTTTPIPPPVPTDVLLSQSSDDVMMMSWQSVEYPYTVSYEVQVRIATAGQDFQQGYKGSATTCSLPVMSTTVPHEARVRAYAVCMVNGREEALWSGYCTPPVQCVCRASEEVMEESSQEATVPAAAAGMGGVSNRTKGLLLLVMFTLVTLIVAFLMGQYAV